MIFSSSTYERQGNGRQHPFSECRSGPRPAVDSNPVAERLRVIGADEPIVRIDTSGAVNLPAAPSRG